MSKRPENSEERGPGRRALRSAADVVAVLLLIVAFAAVSGCCERLFYYPDDREYSTPAEAGLRHEAVEFRSADGTRLSGWFLPAVGAAKGTVVHCHGNAQNMTSHWRFVEFLPRLGYNLFVFDYRGYGASDGRPTRQGTFEDAEAAVAYVRSREDVDPERVGLFGQSLGGAIAVVVAARDPRIKGAVIDSAFSSHQAEAAHALRGNPVTWLLAWPLSRLVIRSGLDPIDYVADLPPRPVLFVHGTADRVVPCEMTRELAEKAGRRAWLVDGARHTAAVYVEPEKYRKRVDDVFTRAFAKEEW